MADPLHGTDFWCEFDIDPNLTVVSGRKGLAQAVARRVLAQPGTLIYDDDYGAGAGAYLNGPVPSAEEVARICVKEALKDERIIDAAADVTLSGEDLVIKLLLQDQYGPFALTLTADALTTEILTENT